MNYTKHLNNPPADGIFIESKNIYITGAGQRVSNVHPKTAECREHGCVIHNQTDHPLRGMPTLWRSDRRIMERTCPHGVGHPDPDNMAYFDRHRPGHSESVHGCCGICCSF